MSIKKITCTHLELNAKEKALSKLNVEFYDNDINTAVLRFAITRCHKEIDLILTKAKSYIVLVASDGSKVYDETVPFNESKGLVSYTIPDWFLKHAGTVKGQIYVHQNDNVLVTRTFSFTLKDSLVSEYSAETKVEYIKTFHDLEAIINERVKAIEEALENGEDYVTAIEQAASKAEAAIEKIALDADNKISEATKAAQTQLDQTSEKTVAEIKKESEEVLAAIKSGNFVKVADTATWQKDKVWNDDGTLITKTNYDLLNITDLKTQKAYISNATNFPEGVSTGGYYERNVRTAGFIEVYYSPYNENSRYRNAYDKLNSRWLGWEKNLRASDTVNYQRYKLTNDDGLLILSSNYDLLNITDLKNKNIYVTTPLNGPDATNSSGYYKRNVRDGGYMEVYFSAFGKNEIYRNAYNAGTSKWLGWLKLATNTDISTLQSSITTMKPVALWSGSAKGVSTTTYKFSRAINTNRKIRVTYDYPGGDGKTAIIDLTNTKNFIIHDLNLVDSGSGGGVYEAQIDFTSLSSFQITLDAVYDFTTGKTTLDKNAFTVRKVEEVD